MIPVTYIYGLLDPLTNALRYVGKSTDPRKRLRDHINHGLKNTRKGPMPRWIKELHLEKLVPQLVLIEATSGDEWREREMFWMQYLRKLGYPLLNSHTGVVGATAKERAPEQPLMWWTPTSAPLGLKYKPKRTAQGQAPLLESGR